MHLQRWKVTRSDDVDYALEVEFGVGIITADDMVLLKRWAIKVEEEGPESLQKTSYWEDYPLDDEWQGYRVSCFSNCGRIIYRVIDDTVEVRMIRIVPEDIYEKED